MSYPFLTYHWPLLSRPQVAGFKCPVTSTINAKVKWDTVPIAILPSGPGLLVLLEQSARRDL
jgi:hypothetical protein